MTVVEVVASSAFVAGLVAALVIQRRAAKPSGDGDLIDRVDSLLPQTQCGQCTFAGCRPYATAMVRGEAEINQCPPGGHDTARRLARLLKRDPKPVDARFGDPLAPPLVAFVIEDLCIGCARCIPACPVDAIVGAAKFTHTVIAADCTGCKLCLPPCPVDCIEMRPASRDLLDDGFRNASRERFNLHTARLARQQSQREQRSRERRSASRQDPA
jgi:electron transport complex protein RnfB